MDALRSSRSSIAHANRHIDHFETAQKAFLDSEPYARVAEPILGTGDYALKVKLVKPFPDALAHIAFDCISNLRAALDQAGHGLAVAGGKTGRQAQFPFGNTQADVEGLRKRGCRDLPDEVFAAMAATQPHKGGNYLLWALNKLCNSQKHEIVTPMANYIGSAYMNRTHFSKVRSFIFPPRWDSTKNEMVIAVLPNGAPFLVDIELSTFIAFGKPELAISEPAIVILRKMAHTVNDIVDGLESVAERLGFK